MRYQGINLINPKAQKIYQGAWILSFWQDYADKHGFMLLFLKTSPGGKSYYSLKRVDTFHEEN